MTFTWVESLELINEILLALLLVQNYCLASRDHWALIVSSDSMRCHVWHATFAAIPAVLAGNVDAILEYLFSIHSVNLDTF